MTKGYGLSAAEIAAYHDRGYVGPFDLVGRDEAIAIGGLLRRNPIRRPRLF